MGISLSSLNVEKVDHMESQSKLIEMQDLRNMEICPNCELHILKITTIDLSDDKVGISNSIHQ